MKHLSRVLTMGVSLAAMMGLTVITQYVVTRIPDEINSNIDVNTHEMDTGVTPLMQAAIDSDYEKAKLLIEAGANVNERSATDDRDVPLNYALINGGKLGSLAVAELLIANGADVNAANARGLAPIHAIMQITQAENRLKMLHLLMSHGANINAQAEDGSTMMHITVTNNDPDWVDVINDEYGQIVNYNIRDNKARTPLLLAIELGRVSVNGARSVEDAIRRRPGYIGDDYNVQATDGLNRSGLQLAIIRGDQEYTDALIARGASVVHQDVFGNSPLHYAVANPDPLAYVGKILDAARKDAQLGSKVTAVANKNGQTPLYWAMRIRNPALRKKVTKMLVSYGSPIANKDVQGLSVLDLARQQQDQEIIDMLEQALRDRSSVGSLQK